MEQATIDYFETIFFEVVNRNPEKFVPVLGTRVKSETIQWWLQQEEQIHAHTNIKRT